MSFDYINEAFKKLDLLEEQMFDTSLNGINELSDFMNNDNTEEIVRVIDPEADTTEEVQDSYVGKVIINCNVCHSHIFENKEEITIEEEGSVNSDMECPYCGEHEGFTIVGEIAPYETEADTDIQDVQDVEESPAEETNEGLGIGAGLALGGAAIGAGMVGSKLLDSYDEKDKKSMNENKSLSMSRATRRAAAINESSEKITMTCDCYQNAKSYTRIVAIGNTPEDAIIKILGTDNFGFSSADLAKLKDASLEEIISAIKKTNASKGTCIIEKLTDNSGNTYFQQYIPRWESLSEDFKEVSIRTEDQKLDVSSDENGKVTVVTEPITQDSGEGEMITPVSAETEAEILTNNDISEEEPSEEESFDFDFEDVDEEGMDELGESYLRKVYENVNSFKTTSVAANSHALVVEGLITFSSGAQKKTGFIFEAQDVNRRGQLRFRGSNKHLTESSDAFSLVGRVDNKKLFVESLKYDYKVNNESIRGLVRRK